MRRFINADNIDDVNNGTSTYCRYIKRRIANNKNFLGVITGSTGSGKSYAGLKLMEMLNPDKTPEEIIKNVSFNAKEFISRINSGEMTTGLVLMWDETGVGLSSRNWQSMANKSINYLLQTFRNMNLIVIFTLPYFSFLDVTSRKLMHSLMQTVKVDRRNKFAILKPFVLHTDQHTGKIYNPYLKVKNKKGKIVKLERIRVDLASEKLIKLYEEKKTAFTKELNADIEKKLDTAKKKDDKEIDNLTPRQREVVALYESGLNQTEIGEKLGIGSSSVSGILASAKLRGKVMKIIEKPIEIPVLRHKSPENRA